MMPPEHGRRRADLLKGRLVEIEASYTVHDSDINAPAPC
jgi:hypothetical protein